MPFITTEEVKEIRKAIKEEFKSEGFKFSVTKEHHSGVCVALMEGSIEVEKTYHQLNHLWIKEHGHSEDIINMVERVLKSIRSVKACKTEHVDSDYGSIPTFYTNVHIGKWNKEYKKVA